MYTEGLGVAIGIGIIALVLPALWIAWWKLADLGGTHGPRAL